MKIFVPEIHCNGCVNRIQTALKNAGMEASADAETKMVTVQAGEDRFHEIADILDDLGFSAEKK